MCKSISGDKQCYLVGTASVKTACGFKPLSRIKQNDFVCVKNIDTSEQAYKKVMGIYSKDEQEFVQFMIFVYPGYETFEVTMDSDIYTVERGWIKASELKHGEHLKNEKGYHLKVESVGKMYAHKPLKAYALELEDDVFYGASKSGILIPSNTEGKDTNNWSHIDKLRERGPVLGSNSFTFSTGACGGNPFTDQKDENS